MRAIVNSNRLVMVMTIGRSVCVCVYDGEIIIATLKNVAQNNPPDVFFFVGYASLSNVAAVLQRLFSHVFESTCEYGN